MSAFDELRRHCDRHREAFTDLRAADSEDAQKVDDAYYDAYAQGADDACACILRSIDAVEMARATPADVGITRFRFGQLCRSHARLLASLGRILDAADARYEEYGDPDHPDVKDTRRAMRQAERVVRWIDEDKSRGEKGDQS